VWARICVKLEQDDSRASLMIGEASGMSTPTDLDNGIFEKQQGCRMLENGAMLGIPQGEPRRMGLYTLLLHRWMPDVVSVRSRVGAE
jgi:hypothetical protein